MQRFCYVAWFRDLKLAPDDQDYEWPACFYIHAPDAGAALQWGDVLARKRAAACPDEDFLRSYIDPTASGSAELPQVTYGQDAPRELIGW